MARKYRINAAGEETPVWASNASLRALGTQWGRAAFERGQPPIRISNREHDAAALQEYQRLVNERAKDGKNS